MGRAKNVPARVLLVHNDQGFWTQMHYMVEYYLPGYGWVLIETTRGETPYETKRQVVNRVCYPEDEEDTKEKRHKEQNIGWKMKIVKERDKAKSLEEKNSLAFFLTKL